MKKSAKLLSIFLVLLKVIVSVSNPVAKAEQTVKIKL